MSRLRIQHRTEYEYVRPITLGRHRLVLRPREGHDLRVESMHLVISPAYQLTWSRDVFGNSIAIVDFLEPTDKLEILNDVIVSRTSPFPEQSPHSPWPIPFPVIYDPLEMGAAAAYQSASFATDANEVREWVNQVVPKPELQSSESILFALGEAIYRQIKYQRRSEKGVQSPLQTLSLASGSCRDMATLMMEAGRTLGIATRFASGYLDCPAAMAGHASTHAWTEYYLPTLGWRGFDPTLGQPTSLKHVVTGVSNQPRGVMPVSGSFHGSSADYQKMTVQVTTETLLVSVPPSH